MRDRMPSVRDEWDPEDATTPGVTNGRVKELSDPDAYVMLGKLASAVARLETQVREVATEWRRDRAALRRERRRGAINVAAIVGGLQVVVETLRQMGVLK